MRVLACIISGVLVMPSLAGDLDERLWAFDRSVTTAKRVLRVTDPIIIIVTPEIEYGALAYSKIDRVEPRLQYSLRMSQAMVREAPELLFEHIAYHEVCHIQRRDHIRKMLESLDIAHAERKTEECVIAAVGKPRHRQYLQTIVRWRAHEGTLEKIRLKTVEVLEALMSRRPP